MGFVAFVENCLIGPSKDIEGWEIWDWVVVCYKCIIIVGYLLLHTTMLLARLFLQYITLTSFFLRSYALYRRFWWHIPLLGTYFIQIASYLVTSIPRVVLPTLAVWCELVELVFQIHIVELIFGHDKKTLNVILKSGSADLNLYDDEFNFMTTLLISNHRSLVDYVVLQYLIKNSMGNSHSRWGKFEIISKYYRSKKLEGMRLQYLSWGQIVKFPNLLFGIHLLSTDENNPVNTEDIEYLLKNSYNQTIILFPEVNIMTTELSIVQRTLNSNKSFTTQFRNVLNPRFKAFVNTIDCFARFREVPRLPHLPVITETKHYLNQKMESLFLSLNEGNDVQDDAVITHILDHSGGNFKPQKRINEKMKHRREKIRINPYLYDVTILYYRIRYVTDAHNHEEGSIVPECGYQLEQISPSLLEFLRPDSNNTRDPIITMISVQKHETDPLLCLKDRHLEKWLEDRWKEKDAAIKEMVSSVKLT
ncbi:Protein MUM3 [Nakaseomyces bracarensis]|uniref:Protein MUM3 n=1 Tax=Nakaseomyces bracarensis TaxID=273131 RepID=A0ABR4NNB8_9SACH